MSRVGLVVVMSVFAMSGCEKKREPKPATGSASAVATGSGSAAPADATTAAPADAATATTTAPAGAFTITEKGLGAMAGIAEGADDDTIIAALQKAFSTHPELAVTTDVMDLPGEVEAEEGYISVRKGESEVLAVMRSLEVHARDPLFSTTDGIKPGDPAAVLGEKRKDVTCTADRDNERGLLTCVGASEPSITFVIDAERYKGKSSTAGVAVTPAELGTRKIFEIVR